MVHLEIPLGKEQPHVAIVRRREKQCFERVLTEMMFSKYERDREDKTKDGLRKKKKKKKVRLQITPKANL